MDFDITESIVIVPTNNSRAVHMNLRYLSNCLVLNKNTSLYGVLVITKMIRLRYCNFLLTSVDQHEIARMDVFSITFVVYISL